MLSEKWVMPEHPEQRDLKAARIEDELQDEMARFSRRGRHVRVDSGHLMPFEKPKAIVDAVAEVVTFAREN